VTVVYFMCSFSVLFHKDMGQGNRPKEANSVPASERAIIRPKVAGLPALEHTQMHLCVLRWLLHVVYSSLLSWFKDLFKKSF
jgi:hypothetical protein